MNRYKRWAVTLGVLAISLLNGCGGGSTPSVTQISTSDSSTRTYELSGSAASLALPPVGDFTGVLAFPAVAVPPQTKLSLTTSLQPPDGAAAVLQSRQRDASATPIPGNQSGGLLTVYFYITLVSTTTVKFPSVPGFTVTLPSTTNPAGQQFSYAIQQRPASGAEVTFRTEGPATVLGRTVSFAASPTPLTIEAGQRYIIAFYSTARPATDSQRMYVLNGGAAPKVTVYAESATGNVAPVRTISGSNTNMANANSIAVDENGLLYVLNVNDGGAGPPTGISVYAVGANGNVAPIRTIAGSNTRLTGRAGGGMGLDGKGHVAVISAPADPNATNEIDVFDAAASGNVAPLQTIAPGAGQGPFISLSGNKAGGLAALGTGATVSAPIFVYGTASNGKVGLVRAITGDYNGTDRPIAIALHSTGEIAVSNDGDGNAYIGIYAPTANGQTTTTREIGFLPMAGIVSIFAQLAYDGIGNLAVPVQPQDSDHGILPNSIDVFGPDSTRLLGPLRTLAGPNTGLVNPSDIEFGP